ncbi:MAG: nitronate monooxygenase, partial [Actinomycetota bacterium]|nr:nitronate monooxygenase [Actinomycetota bacterium]
GTVFLASREAAVPESWKRDIVGAASESTVRATFLSELLTPPGGEAYRTAPRVLRTPFITQWLDRDEAVRAEADRLREELLAAMRDGRGHEFVPLTGQSAGLVREVLPAAEILRRMVEEAEAALLQGTRLVTHGSPESDPPR